MEGTTKYIQLPFRISERLWLKFRESAVDFSGKKSVKISWLVSVLKYSNERRIILELI